MMPGRRIRRESGYLELVTTLPEVHAYVTTDWQSEREMDGDTVVLSPWAETWVWWKPGDKDGRSWHVSYPPDRVSEGGLAEAHEHIVDQVRRGETPGWGDGLEVPA